MLRPATLQDLGQIMDVAIRLAEERYPLRVDKDRMKALGTELISGAAHFAWVDADEDNRIRAVLMAHTGDNLWAQRKNASVLLWWSERPGLGWALLRRFRDWITSRRAIRVAGLMFDCDVPAAARGIAERTGFVRTGDAYLLFN